MLYIYIYTKTAKTSDHITLIHLVFLWTLQQFCWSYTFNVSILGSFVKEQQMRNIWFCTNLDHPATAQQKMSKFYFLELNLASFNNWFGWLSDTDFLHQHLLKVLHIFFDIMVVWFVVLHQLFLNGSWKHFAFFFPTYFIFWP